MMGGKSDVKDRYFESVDAYDEVDKTTFILPLFLEAEEEDVEVEEQADTEGDQVFLDSYISEFVENVLSEVDYRLIDKIADEVINEDDDDDDASRYELHSKK